MQSAGTNTAPGPATTPSRPGVSLTDLSLLAMALIWGVNFSVVKYATGQLHPLVFNAVRVMLAALALLLIAAVRGNWPRRADVLPLLALGALGNGVYQLFFVEGVAHTRAGDAALVIAATPALIAMLGRVRGTEHVTGRGWIGIALSIAGIGLVAYGAVTGRAGDSTLFGNLLILGGSASWALYTVLLRPYTNRVDGVSLAGITMMGGALPLALVAVPLVGDAPWMSLPPQLWWAMLYSGLGALVVAYLFWYNGVRTIGPTKTAMYSNLQPLFALAVAYLMLREVPTAWQMVGAASIMSGLLMTRA